MNIEIWTPKYVKKHSVKIDILDRRLLIEKLSSKYVKDKNIPDDDYVFSTVFVQYGPHKPLLQKQTMFVRVYCEDIDRMKEIAEILSPFADVECYQVAHFVERKKD